MECGKDPVDPSPAGALSPLQALAEPPWLRLAQIPRAAFGKSSFHREGGAGTFGMSSAGNAPSPPAVATPLHPEVPPRPAHLDPADLGGGNPSEPPGERELMDFYPFAVSRVFRGAELPSSGTEHPCRAAPAPGPDPSQRELPTGKAAPEPPG